MVDIDEIPFTMPRGRGRGRGRGIPKPGALITNSPARISISEWALREEHGLVPVVSSPPSPIPKAKAQAPTARIKVEVLNEQDLSLVKGPLCVKIQKVDVEAMLAHVTFESQSSSILLRTEMDSLNKFHDSSEASQYKLNTTDASEGEILLVRDEQGGFHRGKILSVDTTKRIGTAVDVDDLQRITFDDNSIYRLRGALLDLPYNVVKCHAVINYSKVFEKWVEENHFMFESEGLLERTLFSALEMCEGRNVLISKLYKKPDEGLFTLSVEVLGTKVMRRHFLLSLIYLSVPRTPAIGGSKIAWITNIRKDWKIDVAFCNKAWFGLREAIYEIQKEHNLFSPLSSVDPDCMRLVVDHFRTYLFLAPIKNAWKELYRVKVLGVDEKGANVHYLDVGKTDIIPFQHLVAPLRASFVPELVELLPPMAFTVQVIDNVGLDAFHLDAIRSLLESRPCYLKMVEDNSSDFQEPPRVELYALLGKQVKPVANFIKTIAGRDKSGTNKRDCVADGEFLQAQPLIAATEKLQSVNDARNRPTSRRPIAKRLECFRP